MIGLFVVWNAKKSGQLSFQNDFLHYVDFVKVIKLNIDIRVKFMKIQEFRDKMKKEGKIEEYHYIITPIGVMYSTPHARELLDKKW